MVAVTRAGGRCDQQGTPPASPLPTARAQRIVGMEGDALVLLSLTDSILKYAALKR